MKKLLTRKRLAMAFSVLGVILMGVDLLITQNFFVHTAELMGASIFCLILGLVLDRQSRGQGGTRSSDGQGSGPSRKKIAL